MSSSPLHKHGTNTEKSSQPSVLVVDDDRLTRLLLRQALEHENYRVIEVSNGEDCLKIYEELQPNLILLDAMMPMMTGFECCERLSKLENIQHTPILIITGLEDESTINWAFQVGATDYITKPINAAILRQRVRLLIERSRLFRELENANRKLHDLATIDGLTQVFNRRFFDDYLTREWLRSIREGLPISLILCDVDCFKLYNDTYGHLAGDLCLKKVSNAISQAASRATDITSRYGGEEFAVILPNTSAKGAIHVAQRIQANVQELALPHKTSPAGEHVTLSQGVASIVPQRDNAIDEIILAADHFLYQAKKRGRNQYCY